VTYESLEEIRRIKEQCSRERLARTPEEQKLENQRLKAWFEGRLGRPIRTVDYSRGAKVAEEEPARSRGKPRCAVCAKRVMAWCRRAWHVHADHLCGTRGRTASGFWVRFHP
jgi:hypothetical protein